MCASCKGLGVKVKYPEDPFGNTIWKPEIVPCQTCSKAREASGLSGEEKDLTLADIHDRTDDTAGIALALRVAGGYFLDAQMGFALVYGKTGNAKTLWLKALVASFARAGLSARFLHGKSLEESLFKKDADTPSGTLFDILERVDVLAIDEADKINFSSDWISGQMSKLFSARHDRALAGSGRKITLMAAQYAPDSGWCPDYLLSRVRDGNFSIPWPGNIDPPPCVDQSQGEALLRFPMKIDLPDYRPSQLSAFSRRSIHRDTGEVMR